MQFQNENDQNKLPKPPEVAPLSAGQLTALLRYIDARIAESVVSGRSKVQVRQRIRAEQLLYQVFGIE